MKGNAGVGIDQIVPNVTARDLIFPETVLLLVVQPTHESVKLSGPGSAPTRLAPHHLPDAASQHCTNP